MGHHSKQVWNPAIFRLIPTRVDIPLNKEINYYYLEYSDYWPHLYCYSYGRYVCWPSSGVVKLGVFTESWTESFIWTIGVDCSNSVNHDWVQVLTELEQSPPAVQIKGSLWDFVWTPEFDMKYLKKAEGYISWNVMVQ